METLAASRTVPEWKRSAGLAFTLLPWQQAPCILPTEPHGCGETATNRRSHARSPCVGFSLVEIMVVVAIVAVLAAVALPTYQDFTVRAKIAEGVIATGPAKERIASAFTAAGPSGLASAKDEWNKNLALTASKYVGRVEITNDLGEITVTFNSVATNGLPDRTVVITPSVAGAVLSAASRGTIDWSCASQGHDAASKHGLPYAAGTLEAKYAPFECR